MDTISLMPLAGMNTVEEDAALKKGGDAPRLYVRDAVNVNLTPAGKAEIRASVRKVSDKPIKHLWASLLHGDTFGALGDQWVRVNPATWDTEPLATVGEGDLSFEVLNNQVLAAGPAGIYVFDGARAQRLTIDTPPPPMVAAIDGALVPGSYGVAVAWLRGATESAPSGITHVAVSAGAGLDITLPLCMDASVTHARLYFTHPDGGELARGEDYPISTASVTAPLLPRLGAPPQFLHKSPMPTGKFLKYWRGRLLTARANVLRFSEPLAYHLHNERHGFVQMAQRITFVVPVDGGIWVGQVDHVAFLEGTTLDGLTLQRKAAREPVPGSAILVDAETVGGDLSQAGQTTALWLADNGYVAGNSSGQLVELQRGTLQGIRASAGCTVVVGKRLLTTVS